MNFTEAHLTLAILGPVFQEATIIVVRALVVKAGPIEFTKFRRWIVSSCGSGCSSFNGGR